MADGFSRPRCFTDATADEIARTLRAAQGEITPFAEGRAGMTHLDKEMSSAASHEQGAFRLDVPPINAVVAQAIGQGKGRLRRRRKSCRRRQVEQSSKHER